MMRALNLLIFTTFYSFYAAAPATALSQRVAATYNFVWKGMLVSTAKTTAEISSEAYSLNAEVRMRGLAKLFAGSGKTTFSANGRVGVDGNIQPQEYSSNGKWKGHAYRERLTYDLDGNLSAVVQDWPEKWKKENAREPVPEAMQNGYDPASMFVALMSKRFLFQSTASEAHPAVYKVFDGDTVVSWSVNCANAPVWLEKTKHSTGGQAHECVFSRELLAGQRIFPVNHKAKKSRPVSKRRKGRGRKASAKPYDGPLTIWIRQLENSEIWMPVQALLPSEKGTVKMYLKELTFVAPEAQQIAMNASSR